MSEMDGLGLNGLLQWLGICAGNPLEILVPQASSRSRSSAVRAKVLSRNLPQGAFLELGDGTDPSEAIHIPAGMRVLIDSPSLALVGAACRIERSVRSETMRELEGSLRLIALASEFCGLYARHPMRPHTESGYFDKPGECTRFVTPEELVGFLEAAPMMRGLARARKIAEYAIDGSGSPMETYANLAWTLPPRLGGLSMPKPLANKQLRQTGDHRASDLKHESLRPDFQWPDLGVLGEYLGDKEHSSHKARVEDKNRLQDYNISDYKAFFLMFDDVRNASSLNGTAMMLAGEFAKRGMRYEPYRIRRLLKSDSFASAQARLIATLLPPVACRGEG